MGEYYVYKYVVNKEIIYIGKSRNIHKRIGQHNSCKGLDEKFKPYKGMYDIFVNKCVNSVEMDLIERALINQYKPKLNVVDKLDGFSGYITIKDLEWIKYEKPEKIAKYKEDVEYAEHDRDKKLEENRIVVDIYKYIKEQISIRNYTNCDIYPLHRDKDLYIAIEEPFYPFYYLSPTFWFEKGGINLPIGYACDIDLKNPAFIVPKDFLENPVTKEFERLAKDYLY